MEGSGSVSFIMAFFAGFFAFLSPCVLPLIPSYLSYLTGISFKEMSGEPSLEKKRKIKTLTVIHAASFIAGFTIIFVALGASITALGKLVFEHQPLLKKAGGALIILFGLVIMGVIKLPFLERHKGFSYKKNSVSFLGSFAVGATFAAAWTPCVGPILGAVLVYASSSQDLGKGITLLIAFSLGLGTPFFLSAFAINAFLAYVKKIEKYMKWIMVAAGLILITFGVILLTGRSTL